MNEKKSLLEKYSIPIENLDFDYLSKCQNISELEKIIEILKSGEEGYYPDLTKFAEATLKALDPNNRVLRSEVECQRTSMDERQQINDFVQSIKVKNGKIRDQSNFDNNLDDALPPIRSMIEVSEIQDAAKSRDKRITSTDYNRWDKFDADTECLKIELAEEQMREKMSMDQKRQQQVPKLIEILPETTVHEQMSDVEKHEFADKHRIKGNEFFKCSDYQQAINEYNTSLNYEPTAAVYNNRALVYLKQKKYMESIRDCDECLKLEPENVKAFLRKCDALIATDRKNMAYKLYAQVLKIDPENAIAKKALINIPLRLEIEDVNVQSQVVKSTETKPPNDDEDDESDDILKRLIIPKKIVPSKYERAMSNLKRLTNQKADKHNTFY
ncbi:sperm-associated antigen 1 [Contarinia nasturtii]|uniref:sperm-associated antigen 1 n=1 Tax=Contarinia nasturtii TaxID=265458 RepID=UPI0012D444B4|nr:sperm-associated antigen 1 [Contarinia nasturtii]